MKKTIAFLTAMFLLFQSTVCLAGIGLKYEGEDINSAEQPFLANNAVMVPLRAVMEKLGFRVFYNDSTDEVHVMKDSTYGRVKIGNQIADINGIPLVMDNKAMISNGTTMIPARFVRAISGKYISWDSKTNSVAIFDKQQTLAGESAITIPDNELFINPGITIENMNDPGFGWLKYGYANVEVYGDGAFYGKSCLRVKDRTSRYSGISQDIKEILNKNGAGNYIFSAYVKTYENSPSVGNPYSMIIRIQDEDAEAKTYKKANFSMTDKWQKITLETTLEFNTTLKDGLIYFEGSDEKDLNDYYIDLCSMTKVE